MKVIKTRMKAPTGISADHQDMLHDYVQCFQDSNSGKINYYQMGLDLNTFNFDKETNFGIVPRSQASVSDGAQSFAYDNTRKDIFTDLTVLNTQKTPFNVAEKHEKSLIKMSRLLRNKFASKAAFEEHLVKVADKDQNGNLSADELQSFVIDQCKDDLKNRTISKQDVEGFLSSFVYNQFGGTDIKKVTPFVWEQDP